MKQSFLLLFTAISVLSFAQSPQWNADTIMHKVVNAVKNDAYREATITMKSSDKENQTVLTGEFQWAKWQTHIKYYDSTGALNMEIFEQYDTIWIYDANLNRTSIMLNPEAKAGSYAEGLFFVGPNGFRPAHLDKVEGDTIAVISLYTADPKKTFTRMTVRVDLRTYREVEFQTFNKNGSTTTFQLHYVNENGKGPENVPHFNSRNYPAGMQIFDERTPDKY